MPQLIYILSCTSPLGLIAGLQIHFQAQKFPLNYLENGRIGTLIFSQLYYPSDMFMPTDEICFVKHSPCKFFGPSPDRFLGTNVSLKLS
jgi:hypothetical protein